MKRILLLATVVLQLAACAGGGGGGGANNPGGSAPPTPSSGPTYLRSEVPFSTPTKVATVDPLVAITTSAAVVDTFTANISGSGEDVIIAGRQTQPTSIANWSNSKISMLSWSNGTLVDRTAQWFTGDSNVILGADPNIKFADFFKSGRTDMFVAPSTDAQNYGPAYLYQNTGTTFNRITIPLSNVWGHDTAVADLNGDGYKDFVITDYGPNMTVGINNRVNGFKTYTSAFGPGPSAASVAVADFMGNGTTTMVLTDTDTNIANSTKLYKWAIDGADQLKFDMVSVLPAPRPGINHNIRSLVYDFDSSGANSLLIFGTNTATKYSDIQFLKNNGSGAFTDVTDTTLVGYNHNTYSSYNPKIVDVNGDGLTDILVSGQDFSGNNNSTQVLLRSRDNKYVAAYQNLLTDFATQSNQIQGTDNSSNTVNVVKGPNGKMYLVTATSFMNGADRQLAVYLSNISDSTSVVTPKLALDLIKSKWPYMTDIQANTALAMTSSTYMTNAGTGLVINPDSLLQPIGSLSLMTQNGLTPIKGYIAGADIGDGNTLVLDSIGRGFTTSLKAMNVSGLNSFGYNTEHVDQHNLTSHAEYLVNGSPMTYGNMRIATENRNALFGNDQGPGMLQKPTQYSIGIPEAYRNGKFSYGMQYTNLNTNPWIAFGGAWGSITNSGIMDNVATYKDGGFSAQASMMHVTTNVTPGLITKVNNIVGGWAESGYRYTEDQFGDIGVYAGVKPVVLSGNVEARMPTSVDSAGNIVYTNKKLAIQNQVTPYVRALYTNMIDKKTMYRFSVMGTQQGQYRLMHELRFWID